MGSRILLQIQMMQQDSEIVMNLFPSETAFDRGLDIVDYSERRM